MIVKTMAALIAAFLFVAVTTSAEAKHKTTKMAHSAINVQSCDYDNDGRVKCGMVQINRPINIPKGRKIEPSYGTTMEARIVDHPSGCPRSAFCGCGASVRIFGHPVRELYLAANWFRFAHAMPAPGMVAVRSHHVFVIEQVNGDGTVVAYDANSGGHATRIHTVSLSGYSVRDPHSRQVAMR